MSRIGIPRVTIRVAKKAVNEPNTLPNKMIVTSPTPCSVDRTTKIQELNQILKNKSHSYNASKYGLFNDIMDKSNASDLVDELIQLHDHIENDNDNKIELDLCSIVYKCNYLMMFDQNQLFMIMNKVVSKSITKYSLQLDLTCCENHENNDSIDKNILMVDQNLSVITDIWDRINTSYSRLIYLLKLNLTGKFSEILITIFYHIVLKKSCPVKLSEILPKISEIHDLLLFIDILNNVDNMLRVNNIVTNDNNDNNDNKLNVIIADFFYNFENISSHVVKYLDEIITDEELSEGQKKHKINYVLSIIQNIPRDAFYNSFEKQLKLRIVQPLYSKSNPKLNIDNYLIQKCCHIFDKYQNSRLLMIMKNINNSNYKNFALKKIKISSTTEKINIYCINPIIVNPVVWNIDSIIKITNIPKPLESYFKIVENFYKNSSSEIKWIYQIGYSLIKFSYYDNTLMIRLNILQLIMLFIILEKSKVTKKQILLENNFPKKCLKSVINSLLESNLIIFEDNKIKFNNKFPIKFINKSEPLDLIKNYH